MNASLYLYLSLLVIAYWHVENLTFLTSSIHFLFRCNGNGAKFLSQHYNRIVSLHWNCNIKKLTNKRLNCPKCSISAFLLIFTSDDSNEEEKTLDESSEKMNNFLVASLALDITFLAAFAAAAVFSNSSFSFEDLFKLFMTDKLRNLWS